MRSLEEFKKYLEEQEYNKQAINKVKPPIFPSSPQVFGTGGEYEAKPMPEDRGLLDFIGATVYNTIDSALLGLPDILAERAGIDVPYSMRNFENLDGSTKTAVGLGQGIATVLENIN